MAAPLRRQGPAEVVTPALRRPTDTGGADAAPDAGAAPALDLAGVTKRYGAVPVVDGATLRARRGGFVCVLGPSGCGKTTLLRLIAGFERADSGTIRLGGRDVTASPPEARDYGIVFQSYALFPNRTAEGNVAFGLEATRAPRAEREARVRALLDLVGLGPHAGKYPNQLSGGQQQRVALARALALSPALLLLDEPLSALDANVRAHLRGELLALQRRVGVTALMVTHDREEAFSVADEIVVMNRGRIVQTGAPVEVFGRPATLFVARLLGGCNALPIERVEAGGVIAAGLALRLAVPPRAAGHVCIRPGAVLAGAEAEGAANRFEGRVAGLTFLGDTVRLALRFEHAPEAALEAEALRTRLGRLPVSGEAITVALPPADLMLLDDPD